MPLPKNVTGTRSLSYRRVTSKYKKTNIGKPKKQRVVEGSGKENKIDGGETGIRGESGLGGGPAIERRRTLGSIQEQPCSQTSPIIITGRKLTVEKPAVWTQGKGSYSSREKTVVVRKNKIRLEDFP